MKVWWKDRGTRGLGGRERVEKLRVILKLGIYDRDLQGIYMDWYGSKKPMQFWSSIQDDWLGGITKIGAKKNLHGKAKNMVYAMMLLQATNGCNACRMGGCRQRSVSLLISKREVGNKQKFNNKNHLNENILIKKKGLNLAFQYVFSLLNLKACTQIWKRRAATHTHSSRGEREGYHTLQAREYSVQ